MTNRTDATQGMHQFLDEKAYKPGLGEYDKSKKSP